MTDTTAETNLALCRALGVTDLDDVVRVQLCIEAGKPPLLRIERRPRAPVDAARLALVVQHLRLVPSTPPKAPPARSAGPKPQI